MIRLYSVFRAILIVMVIMAYPIVKVADAADKMAILKSVEGNWASTVDMSAGGKAIRPWVFKVDGSQLVAQITRPGMSPEACRVPLDEITEKGGVLTLYVDFPPYKQKATLEISQGKISGTVWRSGRNPAPVDIVFSRR
jgi:hypothetical protein